MLSLRFLSHTLYVMNALMIDAGETTPLVRLDSANGIFEISGCSRPEDVVDFYKPILDWLKNYAQTPNNLTAFDFKLNYFNTSSSKIIYDIMMILCKIHNDENKVVIRWHFHSDDCDMEEVGMDFSEIIEFPIELIAY